MDTNKTKSHCGDPPERCQSALQSMTTVGQLGRSKPNNDAAAKSGNRPRFKMLSQDTIERPTATSKSTTAFKSAISCREQRRQHRQRPRQVGQLYGSEIAANINTTTISNGRGRSDSSGRSFPSLAFFLALVYFSLLHQQTSIISTIGCDLLLIEQSEAVGADALQQHDQSQAIVHNGLGRHRLSTAVVPDDEFSETSLAQTQTVTKSQLATNHQARSNHHKHRHRQTRANNNNNNNNNHEISINADQLEAPINLRSRDQTVFKIAALATKLEQWHRCNRLNLLARLQQRQALRQAATSTTTTTTTTSSTTEAESDHNDRAHHHHHQNRLSTKEGPETPSKDGGGLLGEQANDKIAPDSSVVYCPAHFDGHLCWPQARAGQLVQLPCPRINYYSNRNGAHPASMSLSSLSFPQSPTGDDGSIQKSTSQQQQQQVGTVIGSDLKQERQRDDETTASMQSIKSLAIESRLGLSALAPESVTTTLMRTATNDAINQESATRKEFNLKPQEEEGKRTEERSRWSSGNSADKYARRRCNPNNFSGMATEATTATPANLPIDQQIPPFTTGQWQLEADYSDCSLSQNSGTNGGGEADNNKSASRSDSFDPTDIWVKLTEASDIRLFDSLTAQLERIEPTIDPYTEPDLLEQWQICISAIVRQQQSSLAVTDGNDFISGNNTSGSQECPIIFDGWRCWPATRAGETAYVNCPSNQPGFSAERMAHKICTLDADWYRHPMTNRYWSNYTTCVDTVDLAFRTKILNLYIIGNLISLIALTMSLIIFVSFKSLNCTRVTIHKNLFLSFITNNLMWIFWYTYVVNDANLLQSNPIGCRLWHILLHYFLVSNYFWMFCEGLYLHTLLVVAFVSEDKILKWFYLLGWLTPIPITLIYAYNRSYDEYYTNFCWMEESPHNIILMAPIGISLLLNLVFLINIVRVLVTKLRAHSLPDSHQTRKAVRATLILIPLLGLHYMLTPFRPEAKSEWEMIYEIIAAVCTSFQGLCVAMLFCFCNGEVMSAIRKKLKDSCYFRRNDHKRTMRSRSNTAISNIFNNNNNNNHNNNVVSCNNGADKSNLMSTTTNNNSHDPHNHLNLNEQQKNQLQTTSNLGQIVSTSVSALSSRAPSLQHPANGNLSDCNNRAHGNDASWTANIGGRKALVSMDHGSHQPVTLIGALPIPVRNGQPPELADISMAASGMLSSNSKRHSSGSEQADETIKLLSIHEKEPREQQARSTPQTSLDC